ncbi:MAG: Holliday junction resolvase RuvX [Phycisphaerae bacterium]|nr:Holliday junction resolvase RuvX [Phycisphaerae bacterium]
MRYLAIDYGLKRTGFAVCDQSESFVSPFAVIDNPKQVNQKIKDVICQENIEAIVIGLPLNMDDSEGFQAKRTKAFAAQLQSFTDLPVYFQDERLSSFVAKEKIAEAEFTRKKKKKRLDAIAAAEILSMFLESQRK